MSISRPPPTSAYITLKGESDIKLTLSRPPPTPSSYRMIIEQPLTVSILLGYYTLRRLVHSVLHATGALYHSVVQGAGTMYYLTKITSRSVWPGEGMTVSLYIKPSTRGQLGGQMMAFSKLLKLLT